jgi:hypothetical protein
MGTFINDQDEKPPFNPRHHVLDDHTLALVMAVLKVLGKEATALEIEKAYFDSKEQVRDYRQSR